MSENFTDGTRDTRLIERALREGWDIPEAILEKLPLRMLQIVMDKSKTTRNQIAAARILVAMHGQNIGKKVEHEHKHAHVHAHATTEEVRRELLMDEQYLEYLRTTATDGNASPVGDDSEPRAVDTGEAPALSGPGDLSSDFGAGAGSSARDDAASTREERVPEQIPAELVPGDVPGQ